MWNIAYPTTNLRALHNPHTVGQCGGMCATWLANMYGRINKPSLSATMPHTGAAIDTHLAALSIPAAKWVRNPNPDPKKPFFFRPDINVLPVAEANKRYVAAAGLKPGPVKKTYFDYLAKKLAAEKESGGYFIDVGGHAIATFVTGKTFAPYENHKRRLYYFDPQHGCFFSEDEKSFKVKFDDLYYEHAGKNPLFNLNDWSFFKADDVSDEDQDEDMGISSLFG
jgi:hypothetical protein